MTELPLVFLGGLLGSAHCLGMCGPFAIAIGFGGQSASRCLARQLTYSAGRLFTYTSAGAAAGFGGTQLVSSNPMFGNLQAALCVLAGALLIGQGCLAAGFLPRLAILESRALPCTALKSVGGLLRSQRWSHVFLAGLLSGFLPCGLVYAYLALAASAASFTRGMMTMAAFGLGTVPMMTAAGFSGRIMSVAFRRRALRLAAYCVIFTGMLTIARGGWALVHSSSGQQACPYCTNVN